MKRTPTRSIITSAIAIIMVMVTLCTVCPSAYAYDNSVDIYVNGTLVDGVEAFLDGDGVVWVSDSFKAARKMFPKETADMFFPNVVEERQLQDMASAFGYSYKLEGKKAYLTSSNGNQPAGSNNNGTTTTDPSNPANNPGNTNPGNANTGTNEIPITIYVNGKEVAVDAYITKSDDTVWLRTGFTALLKLFPTEAAEEHFTGQDVEMRLKPYADKYGYSYNRIGDNVYLKKEDETENRIEVTIYVDGDKVTRVTAWLENGVVWLENGYSAIMRIFPTETANEVFPAQVVNQKLQPYAVEYGYTMEVKGYKVYLTKNSNGGNSNGGTNNATTVPIITTNGVKITGSQAYIDANGTVWLKDGYKDLKKVLPEETIIDSLGSPVAELELKTWAEKYGYTFEQKGNRVTLTKTAEVQNTVKVYLNGMRVQNVDFAMGDNYELLFDYNDIYKVFPEATAWKTQLTAAPGKKLSNSLQRWAEYYKYTYVQNGFRVYMNNNNQKPLEIHVNNRIVDFPDVQPFVKTGRTMVPIRSVAEMLGCEVEWLNGTVKISSTNRVIILYIGLNVYTVNGVEYAMDVAPYVQDGRTLVPIRFIAEAFGFTVKWNAGQAIDVVTLDK